MRQPVDLKEIFCNPSMSSEALTDEFNLYVISHLALAKTNMSEKEKEAALPRLETFLHLCFKHDMLNDSHLILGLVYIRKIFSSLGTNNTTTNADKAEQNFILCLIGFLLARKNQEDVSFNNSSFWEVYKYTVSQIRFSKKVFNDIELSALTLLGWNLFCSEAVYNQYVSHVINTKIYFLTTEAQQYIEQMPNTANRKLCSSKHSKMLFNYTHLRNTLHSLHHTLFGIKIEEREKLTQTFHQLFDVIPMMTPADQIALMKQYGKLNATIKSAVSILPDNIPERYKPRLQKVVAPVIAYFTDIFNALWQSTPSGKIEKSSFCMKAVFILRQKFLHIQFTDPRYIERDGNFFSHSIQSILMNYQLAQVPDNDDEKGLNIATQDVVNSNALDYCARRKLVIQNRKYCLTQNTAHMSSVQAAAYTTWFALEMDRADQERQGPKPLLLYMGPFSNTPTLTYQDFKRAEAIKNQQVTSTATQNRTKLAWS